MQIERINVTNQVIEYIRDNIEGGNWKVGEKIPSENQLTEELGVSRASIRTAIRHYVGLGVLESIQGKGTYLMSSDLNFQQHGESGELTSEDFQNIEKVLEFRCIVEPAATYLAAQNATPQLVERLRDLFVTMLNNVGNRQEFVRADMDFHRAICEYSHNPFIVNCMNTLYDENAANFDLVNEKFGYKDGIYYHSLILKAFEEGNMDGARDYIKEHLEQALDRLAIEK